MFRSRSPRGSLALAVVVVLGVGFVAYAQLGGAGGVVLPYQGTLYSGAVPVSGPIDISFDIYNQESGGGACQSIDALQTPVASGHFAVALSLNDTCVRGRDVWIQLTVDGNALATRQRVFPAISAATSGTGDFHVTGHLHAASSDVDGTIAAGDVSADTVATDDLNVTGPAVIRTGGTATTSIEGGRSLVVTGGFGGGEAENGGIEFRHDNLTQGIGFGYNTIYATGSNASQPLRLESRGTDQLYLNPDGNAPVNVGSELLARSIRDSVGLISTYTRSLERRRVVAPFTASHYRSYTPIPEAVAVSLCGDGDGCTVTLRMVNYDPAAQARTAATRGPYHFDYGESNSGMRAWRLSNDTYGIDGNGTTQHILAEWDCYFTDGAYFQGSTSNNDSARGLGLLNSGNTYAGDCELIIDD